MKHLLPIVAALSAAANTAVAGERPNIVFIFADDMGYSDLGCYGSPTNATPNLDHIAGEGMRFTDFYASAPVSTPSRAGLLTGRYASRLGIRHVFMPYSFTGLSPEEITIAELLRPVGYRTALFGKWHLGSDRQYLPLQQGFDEFFGTACSIDNAPFVYIEGNEAQNRLAAKDSTTITYTQRACDFIRRCGHEQPFFLYVAYNMPHVPLAASKRFLGKSKGGLYGDVVEDLDWGVGEIMACLKEAGPDERGNARALHTRRVGARRCGARVRANVRRHTRRICRPGTVALLSGHTLRPRRSP